jgi:DNA-binding NarL/FixJ family response regulator
VATLCKRVLLVEDSLQFRRFVVGALESCSGDVQVAGEVADGITAIEQAQALRPDLVLLDIGLPKLNGIEVARAIRERCPGSKILFLSQESSHDLVLAALSTGAHGYVLKMAAGRDLVPAVNATLRGERFISSAVLPHPDSPGDQDDEIWQRALPTIA